MSNHATTPRHSAIQFVRPHQRHEGLDLEILAQRKAVYEAAKAAHPQRWSGSARNWEPVGEVWLNPENKGRNPAPMVSDAA